MNSQIQFLVDLIGEEQATTILRDFVQTGLSIEPGKIRKPYTFRNGNSSRTRKDFTDEERVAIIARARELFPELLTWAKTASKIASESGGRSTASIYNLLYREGLVREMNNVTSKE